MVRYIAVGNKKMRKKKSLDGPALLFLEQEIYWKLKLVVMCCFSFLIFTQIMFENQIFWAFVFGTIGNALSSAVHALHISQTFCSSPVSFIYSDLDLFAH